MDIFTRFRRAIAGFLHMGTGTRGWENLPSTKFNYEAEIIPMLNSAVAATTFWIARNFSEAPLAIWTEDANGDLSINVNHPVAKLIRRPNPYYSGALMWGSTMIEYVITGNAFWLKERNANGTLKNLWWVPSRLIKPITNPHASTDFLLGYEYRPGGEPQILAPEDVVHLKYFLDPDDPRRGLGPIASLIREIYTDDQAANFTATLLRNSAVPGTVLIPGKGVTFDKQSADEVKSRWKQEFSGDRQGGLMVSSKEVSMTTVGIDPEKLNLASIRQIPEERVTAVLGIPAAVVGLGTGLEQTKVGATLAEMREQAWENCLIPIGRMISEQIEDQLVRDFDTDSVAAFDLRRVRVLQDDEDNKSARIIAEVKGGIRKVADAQAALGMPRDETQDAYLRNTLTTELVRSGDEVRPPEQIEVSRDDPEDDGEKDYPDFMLQVDRVALAADAKE